MIKFKPLNFTPMINLIDGSYTKWREKKAKEKFGELKHFHWQGTAKHDHYLQKQIVAVL